MSQASSMDQPAWGDQTATDVAQGLIRGVRNGQQQQIDLQKRLKDELGEVLAYLGDRLCGDALDKQRLGGPEIPGCWNAREWRQFFDTHLQIMKWGSDARIGERITLLENENRALQQQLANRPVVPAAAQSAAPAALPPQPASGIISAETVRSRLDAFGEKVPPVPASFAGRFDSANGDRWRRQLMALDLLAVCGFSPRPLIEWQINFHEGNERMPDALRDAVRDLGEKSGLILEKALKCKTPVEGTLYIWQLTDEGRRFAQAMRWEAIDSDWQRYDRFLRGDRADDTHLFLVLSAARLLRQRSAGVQVAPDCAPNGNTFHPDLLVGRGANRWYADVVTGETHPRERWQALAALQNDRPAFFSGTQGQRRSLMAECRRLNLGGSAGDIQTLTEDVRGRSANELDKLAIFSDEW